MKTKKNHIILSILTISLPMLILLIFIYATGNKGVQILIESPTIVIENIDKNYDFVLDPDNFLEIRETTKLNIRKQEVKYYWFAFRSTEENPLFYNNVEIKGEIVLEEVPIIKINDSYYTLDKNKNIYLFDHWKLIKENLFEKGIIIGMSVFIIVITIAILSYMVLKKMDVLKRYRRLSVLLMSFNFTLFFLMLNTITKNIFLVFLVFTVSWLAYYIEWIIHRKRNSLPLYEEIIQKVEMTNGK